MAFDGLTVYALSRELEAVLAGARINKISQTEGDELYITAKPQGQEGTVRLVLSSNASLPLVYLTTENKPAPPQAPAFCMLLRKHLTGGRILSVKQPDFERILRFTIEGLDEMGDRKRHILLIELMGKYSNIILTDEEDRIIDSIRRVSSAMSSVREVLPGRAYFVPAQQGKVPPADADRKYLQTSLRGRGMPLAKAIVSCVQGISTILSQELCYRAGIDADRSAISLTDAEFDRLCDTFLTFAQDLKNGAFSPCIAYLRDIPTEYAAVPLTLYEHTQDARLVSYPDMSPLIACYYREKALLNRMHERSADLRHLVGTLLERSRKKLDLQEKQLADTGKMDRYRLYGELLQAFGYQAEPKAKHLTVTDYHTDQEINIPLDPQLTAQENAGKYFDRYRKLKRTAEALAEQTQAVRLDIEHLMSVEEAITLARTESDLSEIREELAISGYLKKTASAGGKTKGRKKEEKSPPLHYRAVITDSGREETYDLYVGRNNLQNDRLTFQFANGGDWWFHAKKIPGSHVILKVPQGRQEELPDRIFEIAASLAACYSAGSEQQLVEVDYVRRKEVKKPAGAHPGYVIYHTNYSMAVKPGTEGLISVDG